MKTTEIITVDPVNIHNVVIQHIAEVQVQADMDSRTDNDPMACMTTASSSSCQEEQSHKAQ